MKSAVEMVVAAAWAAAAAWVAAAAWAAAWASAAAWAARDSGVWRPDMMVDVVGSGRRSSSLTRKRKRYEHELCFDTAGEEGCFDVGSVDKFRGRRSRTAIGGGGSVVVVV
jgi:hypothetical protein